MKADEIWDLVENSVEHEFLVHDVTPVNPLGEWTPVPDGTIRACDVCGHYGCVCAIKVAHVEDCSFRRAATCAVGIECEHGRDVCPICDPCTCPKEEPCPKT